MPFTIISDKLGTTQESFTLKVVTRKEDEEQYGEVGENGDVLLSTESQGGEIDYFDFSLDWKYAITSRYSNGAEEDFEQPSIELGRFTVTGEIDVLFSDQFIKPIDIADIKTKEKLVLEVLPYEE